MITSSRSSLRAPGNRSILAAALAVAASFVTSHLLFILLPQVFESWNAQTIDQLFLVRSRLESLQPRYDSSIVHIDILDKTLDKLTNSYLSRSEYARVTGNLAEMGVAVQLWDFIFPARTNQVDDSLFIRACLSAGNVYLGVAFNTPSGAVASRRQTPAEVNTYFRKSMWMVQPDGSLDDVPEGVDPLVTFPELALASAGVGFLNLNPDRDGVFRRAPLVFLYQGAVVPSIALRIVCDYLGVHPAQIVIKPGGAITLKNARPPRATPHDIVIPIDEAGNLVVNYIGPWSKGTWQPMRHYDFADVLRASEDAGEMDLWKEELAGRIAVVSQVTTGSTDVGPVPGDPSFPKSGIHANIMHTILTENFLRELSTWEMLALEMLLALAVFALASRFSSALLSLSITGLLMAYLVVAAAAFLYGSVIMNIIRPAFMVVGAMIAIVAHRYVREEKEKLVMQRSFESYFPPSIVKRVMADPSAVMAGGQKKELTILFSDIEGFTRYSTQVSPDQVQKILNEYFGAMTEIVFRHGGTLDKFIGDGLMVFFGDPEPQPDHAIRCVRTAIDMQRKARELRSRWEAAGGMPIQIRIGVNTDVVVVGNMGSSRRLSYTAIGSGVNLAQRLEANAPAGGILIAERTFELVRDHVNARSLGEIVVEGIDEPIRAYEVQIDDSARTQG